jgi:hypothetical protein
MRFWIEGEYKDHKSGGWGWQHTKMEDPKRAERQWLARAVAMHIAVLVGGKQEAEEHKQKRSKASKPQGKRRAGRPPKPVQRPRGREQSCLMRGQQAIQAAVVRGEEMPVGHVVTEAWPTQTYAVSKPTKSWVKKCREKEAKKRSHQNKQARTCQGEQREAHDAAPKHTKQQQSPKPPQHVQRRERVKQEQEAKRLCAKRKREERKLEQEEHRLQKLREREERKKDVEQKSERRLRAREQREQERLWRLQWHEEIKSERARRLARTQERIARRASAAPAKPLALSMLFADDEALAPLPKPP